MDYLLHGLTLLGIAVTIFGGGYFLLLLAYFTVHSMWTRHQRRLVARRIIATATNHFANPI